MCAEDIEDLQAGALSLETADLMVENVVGTFGLPLGVGVNLRVNGKDVLVPMVVEEPSVVAAVSNMARLVRNAGGFTASCDESIMIGQIQLMDVADPQATCEALEGALDELGSLAKGVFPRMEARGGGLRGFEVRQLVYDEPGEPREDMVVLHFFLDCVDAMGANMVNTIAERLAPVMERITGEQVGLRILSNLASRRLARARCVIQPSVLDQVAADGNHLDGIRVVDGITSAYRFAWTDPWRAATHNKGIMNGIDAVAIATGNDWRAIEAGAHAWAARSGAYRSLSTWKRDVEGNLVGELELPVQVGTVGGSIQNHPTVAANLKMMGNPRARELAGIIAAVGLAQNLGALRALATEGIQRGHMRMHARNVAALAGAVGDEVPRVVDVLTTAHDFSVALAKQTLAELRAD